MELTELVPIATSSLAYFCSASVRSTNPSTKLRFSALEEEAAVGGRSSKLFRMTAGKTECMLLTQPRARVLAPLSPFTTKNWTSAALFTVQMTIVDRRKESANSVDLTSSEERPPVNVTFSNSLRAPTLKQAGMARCVTMWQRESPTPL